MIINGPGQQYPAINTTPAGSGQEKPSVEEPREKVDIFLDNQGKSKYENDYNITKKTPFGDIKMFLDNQGKSNAENDYHVTADTPKGKVYFMIDDQGKTHAENDFHIKGKDLKGEFDIFVDNRGKSEVENDYLITGQAYGQKVELTIDNKGKSEAENDFALTGDVPKDFLTSPLFSDIILPSIATIPILNESDKVPERVKGPLFLNMGMSFLSAVEREMKGE